MEEITVGGDITQSGSNFTINANAVTDSDIRQSSGLSVIGRSANTTGNVADIAAANDGEVLRRSGTAVGFGTIATAGIANSAVTYAKIQNVSATQRVLGRNTAGAGVTEEVSASGVLDWIGSTRGQILFRGASGWSVLSPGTAGYLLSTGGAGADPSWVVSPGSPFASDISVNSINIGRGGGSIVSNTIVGTSALNANTTGTHNTAVGYQSLTTVSTGIWNTAVGSQSLKLNTGTGNASVGAFSMAASGSGGGNAAVGSNSLENNGRDVNNTPPGVHA